MFVCNRISKYKNIYTHTYVCKYINYAGKSPEKSYQLDKHGTHTHQSTYNCSSKQQCVHHHCQQAQQQQPVCVDTSQNRQVNIKILSLKLKSRKLII